MKTFVEFLAEKYDLIDEAGNSRYGQDFWDAIKAEAGLSDEEKHRRWQDRERDKMYQASNQRYDDMMHQRRQDRERDKMYQASNQRYDDMMHQRWLNKQIKKK